MADYGFGGVLADDMGLGKTLQTLSFLLWEKEQGRRDAPALVVAPTSLLGNWRREAERFAPGLRVEVLHGPERHPRFAEIPDHDLVITSYALIPRDLDAHRDQRYRHLILDEAQQVKNPRAKAAQALRAIPSEHRLCLTGTPMENHLGELWALFDFLMPGFLGDQSRFARLYRTPVEKHGDGARQQALARRVAPFLLRRTKDKVAAELPPKSEIPRSLELAPDQRRLYEAIRLAMEERVRKLLQKKGVTRSRIEVLDALLKLRQACCDPRLVKLDSARRVKGSAKLELLREMLPELVEEGRRILLFSSFTSMLALIEQELRKLGIDYTKLTGQTRKREEAVARFQDQGVPVFLISLKAGGVGLNLTAADTVILYDPWWNPAAENQAIDRAHRIGQDKPVLVFRLISEGTVEERVIRLQERKRALAEGVYGSDDAKALAELSADDILGLFAD
jgi:SNF2 family DNA or RNA helicase